MDLLIIISIILYRIPTVYGIDSPYMMYDVGVYCVYPDGVVFSDDYVIINSYGRKSPDTSFSNHGYAYLVSLSGVLIVGYNAYVYGSYGNCFSALRTRTSELHGRGVGWFSCQ